MEVKKSKQADLDRNRYTYLLVGLIVSLSFVWYSFEYKSYDNTKNTYEQIELMVDNDDYVFQTERLKKPKPIVPTTVIEIVDNTKPTNIEVNIDIETSTLEQIEGLAEPEVEEPEYNEKQVFIVVEEYASFPGGEKARIQFLKKNLEYPEISKMINSQGTVYVSFVVEEDGKITNVKIERGISKEIDKEALRVVELMPPWNPGKQRSIPVRTKIVMPIKFRLK